MTLLFESNFTLNQKATATRKTKKNFHLACVIKRQEIKIRKIQLYQLSIHLVIEQINVKKIDFNELYELFKQFKINNYCIKIECERFKFNNIINYLMLEKFFVFAIDIS